MRRFCEGAFFAEKSCLAYAPEDDLLCVGRAVRLYREVLAAACVTADMIWKRQQNGDPKTNVIKLSSKTRLGINMKFETAWEKALCRLFFGEARKKSVQQTSG